MKLTTSVMLGRALEEKTRGLPRWTGRLAERWLLLLSAYLLVDDVREVERTLKKLIQSDPKLRGFDGVFWSGSSDRTLISIPVAVRQ